MGTRGSFPGGKAAGAWSWPLPSSAEVKEWVELYVHSPNTPSWRGDQLKHRDNFTFFSKLYSLLNTLDFIWGEYVTNGIELSQTGDKIYRKSDLKWQKHWTLYILNLKVDRQSWYILNTGLHKVPYVLSRSQYGTISGMIYIIQLVTASTPLTIVTQRIHTLNFTINGVFYKPPRRKYPEESNVKNEGWQGLGHPFPIQRSENSLSKKERTRREKLKLEHCSHGDMAQNNVLYHSQEFHRRFFKKERTYNFVVHKSALHIDFRWIDLIFSNIMRIFTFPYMKIVPVAFSLHTREIFRETLSR
jgi:hypothetical protein